MIMDELCVVKKNGRRIRGTAFIPEKSGARYPAVIFSHGLWCSQKDFWYFGYRFPEIGAAGIFFDFCGGSPEGSSDGSMEKMTPFTEEEDLLEVIAYLRRLDYIDPDRVVLMGESMGGLVSAMAGASLKDGIRGLCLWYPAFSVHEVFSGSVASANDVTGSYPSYASLRAACAGMDPYACASGYGGPVLIIQGDEDLLVPMRFQEKARSMYTDAELFVLHGAGHGFDGKQDTEAIDASVRFVRKALQLQ